MTTSGGDNSNCEAVVSLTNWIFADFFSNYTTTFENCTQKVENPMIQFNQTESQALDAILNDCVEAFTGFLVEAVTLINNVTAVDTNYIFDVVTAGARNPIDLPLRCIANDLTSTYSNITIAIGELSAMSDVKKHGE